MIPNLRHTNEVMFAYVTAAARLHLYSYLVDWNSALSIAKQIASCSYNREMNRRW